MFSEESLFVNAISYRWAGLFINILWYCDETTIALAQGHRSSGREGGKERS